MSPVGRPPAHLAHGDPHERPRIRSLASAYADSATPIRDYAEPGDEFVDPAATMGAIHAHQIVLEVLSETGVVGLLLWIIGAAVAIRAWRRADRAARERAFAPALALAVMCFPLNTHLAFYSAWWGLLFWWLLALFAAAISKPAAAGRPPTSLAREAGEGGPLAERAVG